jgi:predicted kinase
MNMILFTGIQAAGKSTFYRERFFTTHVRLNLDMLRTRTRESILFNACLEANQPFVVDNTNPTIADRARYIGPALAANFSIVGYFFLPDLSGSIARNAARSKPSRVPFPAIYGTHKKLEPPTLSEGYNELYTVSIGPEGNFIIESLTAE